MCTTQRTRYRSTHTRTLQQHDEDKDSDADEPRDEVCVVSLHTHRRQPPQQHLVTPSVRTGVHHRHGHTSNGR